ncbi:MAG TPA: hypothetical protein VD948_02970 [Rhodothermales bacterium]|nr:hypothetical protein [Rhodothermales bacterium]
MHRQPWTEEETNKAIRLRRARRGYAAIGAVLGRTPAAVQVHLSKVRCGEARSAALQPEPTEGQNAPPPAPPPATLSERLRLVEQGHADFAETYQAVVERLERLEQIVGVS